jgi:hypothetical protein
MISMCFDLNYELENGAFLGGHIGHILGRKYKSSKL